MDDGSAHIPDDHGPFFLSFLVGYSHPSLPLGGSGHMSVVSRTHIVIYRLKVNRLSKNLIKRVVLMWTAGNLLRNPSKISPSRITMVPLFGHWLEIWLVQWHLKHLISRLRCWVSVLPLLDKAVSSFFFGGSTLDFKVVASSLLQFGFHDE